MKVSTVLDHIDSGIIALPEFQRGYVWGRNQVRALMDSLYRAHPVGGLLVWVTDIDSTETRGDGDLHPGVVKLLLDGQQRITSLYGIIRGSPPDFFDGDPSVFSGLRFHLEEEVFEFYGPVKMRDDPLWIDVTKLMAEDVGAVMQDVMKTAEAEGRFNEYLNRLSRITNIKNVELHVEEVTGADKTVDVIVEIFNKVNSAGTKLSKGDLALAKICAEWPPARESLRARLAKWEEVGFDFKLDWLLRCINAVVTGEARFSGLEDVSPTRFREGLEETEGHIDTLLNLVGARLGLDDGRVLKGHYAFPLLCRYLHDSGGRIEDHREKDRLLYWFIHSFLWGRYSGNTETVLNQDLAILDESVNPLDELIAQLRQNRGDLRLHPADFSGWSRGSRFYPMLYLMTRVWHAQDWGTGNELSRHLLGKLAALQIHHIFPKKVLYDHGYTRPEVNAIANFTFLTQDTNLQISDRKPVDYLPEYARKYPGAVESHWMPMDPGLWRVENYLDFLEARQSLLASAANEFLGSLLGGAIPAPSELPQYSPSGVDYREIPGGVVDDEEHELLIDCNRWIARHGLPEGNIEHEIVDERGSPIAILDLAWPDGIQEGLSEPVALLIDEVQDTEEAANAAGFRFFTDLELFKQYVKEDVLGLRDDEPDKLDVGPSGGPRP